MTFSHDKLEMESRVSAFDFLHFLLHYHPSGMFLLPQLFDLLAAAPMSASSQEVNCLIHICKVWIVKF